MAFSTKYQSLFKDILSLDWSVYFEKDPYTESITDLKPTENPLNFDFLSPSDDWIQDPIKGTLANIGVYSQTNFQLSEFFETQERTIRCSIYAGSNLFFRGFVLPLNTSEPYDGIAYPVNIVASDGLGLLNNILFDDDGTKYTGRQTVAYVIFEILSKIGFTGFTEFINLYEENNDSGSTDSPFDQNYIDVSLFDEMYCYDVLKIVLNTFGAVIRQRNGVFVIYRPAELSQDTIYGRIFTSATAKTGTTLSPDQFISRSGSLTDIRDIEGGSKMNKQAYKKIIFTHDYGYKESWIFNWKLEPKTYQPVNYTFDGWTRINYCAAFPVRQYYPKEKDDGMLVQSHNNYPTLDTYLRQYFGTYALGSSDVIVFEFDYFILNLTASPQSVTFYIMVKPVNNTAYLANTLAESSTWETSADYIELSKTAPAGTDGWEHFKTQIPGLPFADTYEIRLYGGNDNYPQIYIGYKELKFYATADAITYKKLKHHALYDRTPVGGRHHRFGKMTRYPIFTDVEEIVMREIIKTNSINGSDIQFENRLGDVADSTIDNVCEQFNGALSRNDQIIGGTQNEIVKITKTADDPFDVEIYCFGHSATMTWNTDPTSTVDSFVNSNPDFGGVSISNNNDGSFNLEYNGNFGLPYANPSPYVIIEMIQEYNSGSAIYGQLPTASWNSRSPGGEDDPILDIIAEETKTQLSRNRQMIQLPIIENDLEDNSIHINIIGNFQDALNTFEGDNRIFAANQGGFNARNRSWELDLIEII